MKKTLAILICVTFILAVIPASVSASAEPSATVSYSVSNTVMGGNTLYLDASVYAVGSAKLSCAEFQIAFDTSAVSGAYVQSQINDTSCIVATPGNSKWENAIRLENGRYYCSFMPDDTGTESSAITADKPLVIRIPFTTAAVTEKKTAAFSVENVTCGDLNLNSLSGSAEVSSVSAEIVPAQTPVKATSVLFNIGECGIGIGAKYVAAYIPTGAVVVDLGTAVAPSSYILSGELTLDTEGAAVIRARSIANFDASKTSFEQYDEIIYRTYIINIPEKGYKKLLTFRPYVAYMKDGVKTVVYGDAVEYSYNTVKAAFGYSGIASGIGDNGIVLPEDFWG